MILLKYAQKSAPTTFSTQTPQIDIMQIDKILDSKLSGLKESLECEIEDLVAKSDQEEISISKHDETIKQLKVFVKEQDTFYKEKFFDLYQSFAELKNVSLDALQNDFIRLQH